MEKLNLNSTTKTLINNKLSFENCFQEILYRTKSQYINILTYRPLSGSSYVKLPAELRSSKKGLINIKNKHQKCFLWCHVRHINAVKIHPERITWEDKKPHRFMFHKTK